MSVTNKEKPFRPMKGENVMDCLHLVTFPCRGSYKIDGIRAVNVDGTLLSNTLKPLPNALTQARFASLIGFDGELVCGAPNDPNCMQNTSSAVMSKGGEPDVKFYVFDYIIPGLHDDTPWRLRQEVLRQKVAVFGHRHVVLVEQRILNSMEELLAMEEEAIGLGYEGLMLSWEEAPYKFGKATGRQNWRNKLKRQIDGEAVVVDFKPWEENQNEAVVDGRGLTVRTSEKAFMVPRERMGAFICRDLKTGEKFSVIGGSLEERDYWWSIRETLRGKIIRYKSLPTGVVDKPRSPVFGKAFDGFRHPDDITGFDMTRWQELMADAK